MTVAKAATVSKCYSLTILYIYSFDVETDQGQRFCSFDVETDQGQRFCSFDAETDQGQRFCSFDVETDQGERFFSEINENAFAFEASTSKDGCGGKSYFEHFF